MQRRVLLVPKLGSGVWASLLSASGARFPQNVPRYPEVVQGLLRKPLPGPALECSPEMGGAGGSYFVLQSGLALGGSVQAAESPNSEPDHRVHPICAHQLCDFWAKDLTPLCLISQLPHVVVMWLKEE